uniref:Uncharacterized protein n=1 Tax=Magallana gigas TaxID=29159 RepID=A0A8W8N1H2_MAGGI
MDSVPPGTCEEMQQLSESVFYGLCEKLGTSQQVAIRRETKDIKELVMESAPSEIYDGMQHMSEPVFECMCEIVGTSQQLAIRREAMDIGDVLDRQEIRKVQQEDQGQQKTKVRAAAANADTAENEDWKKELKELVSKIDSPVKVIDSWKPETEEVSSVTKGENSDIFVETIGAKINRQNLTEDELIFPEAVKAVCQAAQIDREILPLAESLVITDTGQLGEELPELESQELSTVNWQQEQDDDPVIGRLKILLESDYKIDFDSLQQESIAIQKFWREKKNFELRKGILVRNTVIDGIEFIFLLYLIT